MTSTETTVTPQKELKECDYCHRQFPYDNTSKRKRIHRYTSGFDGHIAFVCNVCKGELKEMGFYVGK